MDAIVGLATALALGIAAGLTDTASQAISDGYAALKALLRDRHPEIDLAPLEADPTSVGRRTDVEDALRSAGAGADPELLRAAQALLAEVQSAPGAAAVIGVRIADVRARALVIGHVVSSGSGVVVTGSTFADDIIINNVSSGQGAPTSPAAASAPAPVKSILFLAANPRDTDRLRLDEEFRAMSEALRQAGASDRFVLATNWAVRVTDVLGALLRTRPDIVHFSGHGNRLGELVLEDESGQARPVTAEALAGLFRGLDKRVGAVLLNACYGGTAGHVLTEHVDYVIGMTHSIGDQAAVRFAAALYTALGNGQSVANAFTLACAELHLEGLGSSQGPVLLVRRDGQVLARHGDGDGNWQPAPAPDPQLAPHAAPGNLP